MKRTAVINVVGLTESLIGEHTPLISAFRKRQHLAHIKPAFPAVTCTAQSDYVTGARASEGHILNTKAQKEAHQKMLVEIRERRAAKEMELKKQNAKKEAVEQALLDIEAEY